jgi:DNA-directed RNA polymerase specialized sigma24 family protein
MDAEVRRSQLAADRPGCGRRPRGASVRLSGHLGELEANQAGAIRSAFIDGLTYEELAGRARVPLGNLKSWIRRGLLKLRACLER